MWKKKRKERNSSSVESPDKVVVDATDGDYNNDNNDNAKVALIEPSYSLAVAVCANLV